jgi:SpoVK/Ycf46/Vps4 family AAA+-type ATPase
MPLQPCRTTRRLPETDDIIFLLSIVLHPNNFIAEQQQQQPQTTTTQSLSVRNSSSKTTPAPHPSTSTSWQQELSSFPTHRRQIILSLPRLANAYHKLITTYITGAAEAAAHAQFAVDDTFTPGAALSAAAAAALEEVENAASTIRENIAEYVESIEGYISSLQQFWLQNHHHHVPNSASSSSSRELQQVGKQLTIQLIRQIRWDERLLNAILLFLDKELYDGKFGNSGDDNNRNNNTDATTDKLHIWGDAVSKMLQINRSYWEFLETEVYIELTEVEHPRTEEGDGGIHIIPIGPSLESKDDENDAIPSCTHFEDTAASSFIEKEKSLHECIGSTNSVEEAVEVFVHERQKHAASSSTNNKERNNRTITSILLMGEEGCGKTHFLDTVQKQYASSSTSIGKATSLTSSLQILRPNYTGDLMGNSIGSTEDRLIALFSYASQILENSGSGDDGTERKCIIMLDDIDQIFSFSNDDADNAVHGENTSTPHNVGKNVKALFLTILDAFRDRYQRSSSGGNRHVLLLCTSRSGCGEVADRFDRIFRRGLPDEKRRRDIILSCLSLGIGGVKNIEDETIEALLSPIVHHSAGKLDCELAQFCREVLLNCVTQTCSSGQTESKDIILTERLRYLDRMLQTKTPQSLRGGSLDGVVDIRVYTPDELQSMLVTDTNGKVHLPLLGKAAKRAHEELMNVVITPLCRSDEIRALLYGGGGQEVGIQAQTIRVGALLAGGPGVGKTSLVYHCAALAAKMSRVSLLEVSATSLVHKELGGSERAVRRLFTAVRAAAPCILLIDGIECVAPKRGNDNTSEGTMDRVLSTFLTEMDGIESGEGNGIVSSNIGVVGITHNPKLIDPALLRPGRLEKTITLEAPDYDARKEIAARQIAEVDFDFTQAGYFDAKSKDDVSNYVAMESAGMSAVEVIAICREASMVCLRELNFEVTTKPLLTSAHFKVAVSTMKGKAGA